MEGAPIGWKRDLAVFPWSEKQILKLEEEMEREGENFDIYKNFTIPLVQKQPRKVELKYVNQLEFGTDGERIYKYFVEKSVPRKVSQSSNCCLDMFALEDCDAFTCSRRCSRHCPPCK